jgi:uncharacterized membrane protein
LTESAPEPALLIAQPRDSMLREEETFRTCYPVAWWFTLLGPFLLTGALLAYIWAVAGTATVGRLVSTAAATFFLLGKLVILSGSSDGSGQGAFFSPGELFALVFYLDVMTAWILTFHLGLLFKLPWVGDKMQAMVRDSENLVRSKPWLRRATFAGLVLYVLLPVAATGSVGGSVFGRLMGLSPLGTFTGTTLGNLISCLIAYFSGEVFHSYVGGDSPMALAGGIAAIIAILWLLNRRFSRANPAQAPQANSSRMTRPLSMAETSRPR